MKNFLLSMMLYMPLVLSAQSNGVTVSGLAINAGTVTFNVNWNKNDVPPLWSDTVWVFVDYNNAGRMERLPLRPGATLTATSAPGMGKVMEEPGNNKGVWVVGNARTNGSFSATVQLLTAAANVGGACVYGSNYPPVGKYTAATNLSFTGTPPYDLVLRNSGGGTVTQTVYSPYILACDYTVQSFTDKTGAPGIFTCMPPATYTLSGLDVCLNGTVTLTLSGSQAGWKYQLYKGSTAVGSTKDGTGGVLTFTDAAAVTGTFNYTVRRVSPAGAQCEMQVSDVRSITVNPLPVATVTAKAICSGQTAACSATLGVGTTTAMTYTWNVGGTSSTTTGNSKTSQALTATTTYTVQLTNANGCVGAVSAPATISTYAAVSAGSITTASTTTKAGTNPDVTVASSAAASGGSGSYTYQWRRTGTSSATLTGSSATYTLSSDAANYSTAGTYYFNRYVKDATCTAWVAAAGTYTLGVEIPPPPGTVTTTLCTQCCYNGSAWVDCYVTTNAYPFNNSTNTTVNWMGGGTYYYSGASSDKDGRTNTAAITGSTGTSAVQLCKNLGTGWYLPAYEELINMSTGEYNRPLNGKSGANLLATPSSYYWSSTELYNDGGRYYYDETSRQNRAVRISTTGITNYDVKTLTFYVRCAWRD